MATDEPPFNVDFSQTKFPTHLVEQAACGIVKILTRQPEPQMSVGGLQQALASDGYATQISNAAMMCLLDAKFLEPREVWYERPSVLLSGMTEPLTLGEPIQRVELHATELLWRWWKQTAIADSPPYPQLVNNNHGEQFFGHASKFEENHYGSAPAAVGPVVAQSPATDSSNTKSGIEAAAKLSSPVVAAPPATSNVGDAMPTADDKPNTGDSAQSRREQHFVSIVGHDPIEGLLETQATVTSLDDITQLADHGGVIVEAQTITPPILSHEGPLPPNQLLANGRTVDLEPKPFKLVEFFWRRPMNDRVLVDTVAGKMWKPNQTWTPGGFANAVTKANAALLEVGAAWTLSQKDGFVLKS